MPVERIDDFDPSPWLAEHKSRYHFARRFVEGKSVLDIACGTGFGGSILLQAGATQVVGADLSWLALERARQWIEASYGLCQCDATKLPFKDEGFDSITSFETLEHIAEEKTFLDELRRVLRPGGVLILSTPNAVVTKPVNGKPRNPFHIREYLPKELGVLLEEYFDEVQLFGQRPGDRFGPCPFWDPPAAIASHRWGTQKAIVWKVLARLPGRTRDRGSRFFLRRPFYPGEDDFDFSDSMLDSAHVLVAVCQKRGSQFLHAT